MPTDTPKRLSADDYLQELQDQSREVWLKSLIGTVLSSRAAPGEVFLDSVYAQFLIEHKLRGKPPQKSEHLSQPKPVQKSVSAIGINLKRLQHENGVNALELGAAIPFHKKLTVVYGKNGSGKSGFVRILKRAAGSRTQEDIWQNIRESKSQNRCQAKIQYADINGDAACQWNGQSGLAPLDQISVFDGKCVPVYLNKSLGFSYQPYGFELFQALSSSLQGLNQRLAASIEDVERKKPLLDDIFNEETSIGKFVGGITATTNLKDLNLLPAWNTKAQKALAEKTKRRKSLQNLDQDTELLQTRLQKIAILEEALAKVQSELSAQTIKTYFGLFGKLNRLKKRQAIKAGRSLKDYDIAQMESAEWEKFVEAGEDYIAVAEREDYPGADDHCIYCRQKLSKGAQKLIQLYRELFREAETSDIESVEAELDEARSDVEGLSFGDSFPFTRMDFEQVLKKRILASAFAALNTADALAQQLASCLKARKRQKLQPVKTASLIASVRKVRAKMEAEIFALEEAQRDMQLKSEELDLAIAELQDAQKLAKYRPQIEKCIAIEQWIAQAAPLQASKLNTRSITELGKKAWRELVSDSFKEQFRIEATNLAAPIVDLEFRGEYGSQVRAKNLDGMGDIDRFLSEGEQKAVALADFFAELSVQQDRAPVIFDDPATSFDHERKEKIAERIARESETRQIVVFTHDLMFASYLHEQVEDDQGQINVAKAAFHDLESEGSRVGVVTEDYYRGSVKFEAYFKKILAKTQETEALTGESRAGGVKHVYGMLRRAVEKAVEERIFGGVVTRWTDQIQMHNASRASLSREKLDTAKQLHEEFSRYIEAHDQSDEMQQHSAPEMARLKADIQRVKDLAVRAGH